MNGYFKGRFVGPVDSTGAPDEDVENGPERSRIPAVRTVGFHSHSGNQRKRNGATQKINFYPAVRICMNSACVSKEGLMFPPRWRTHSGNRNGSSYSRNNASQATPWRDASTFWSLPCLPPTSYTRTKLINTALVQEELLTTRWRYGR